MRWQNPWPWPEQFEGTEEYLRLSLEELYDCQAKIEQQIKKIREEEPPTKRKYEDQHKIWFSVCHNWINELDKIRDAIIEKSVDN